MIRVSADIQYTEGVLAGMEIPAGFTLHVHDMRRALHLARRLAQAKRDGDCIKAAVSGNQYRLVGRIAIEKGAQ